VRVGSRSSRSSGARTTLSGSGIVSSRSSRLTHSGPWRLSKRLHREPDIDFQAVDGHFSLASVSSCSSLPCASDGRGTASPKFRLRFVS